MAVPLAPDRTGEVTFGINMAGRGLPCRYAHGCREHFDPATQNSKADLAAAGTRRNLHEAEAHGYRHVVAPHMGWSYTQKTSARGRSLLGRR